MYRFELQSPFRPIPPQQGTIEKLVSGIKNGAKHQVLWGVTGYGKIFVAANVIAQTKRPTPFISHNKTLTNQLYEELRGFFPNAAVHYFVSYYDYYQSEDYIASSDTYIEKDIKINGMIEQMRHATTTTIIEQTKTAVAKSDNIRHNTQ